MATQTAVSSPARSKAGLSWTGLVTITSAVLMLAALYMALVWAPDAANLTAPAERYAQRIFYFHVPAAWIGFLAYAALVYAVTRIEEEHLTRIYGDPYREYCQRVPRYLGTPKMS